MEIMILSPIFLDTVAETGKELFRSGGSGRDADRWKRPSSGLVGATSKTTGNGNQHEESADELWAHFQAVIGGGSATHPTKRAIMQGVDWGTLYAQHRDETLDPDALEHEIGQMEGDHKKPWQDGGLTPMTA